MYSEPIDKIANNVPVASIFVWRLDLSAGKKRKCKLGIFFASVGMECLVEVTIGLTMTSSETMPLSSNPYSPSRTPKMRTTNPWLKITSEIL